MTSCRPARRCSTSTATPPASTRPPSLKLVVLGSERTHADDAAYGFRKLVDVAVRSIAQPFEDPTTCVQAVDRLHDGLRQLAPRPFPSGRHCDQERRIRLVVRNITWDAYVRLAFDEIRLAGTGSPQVTRRLVAALEDLKTVAPPERQPPLDRQLRLLTAAVQRHYDDDEDVRAALTADAQGIGSGRDLADLDDRTGRTTTPPTSPVPVDPDVTIPHDTAAGGLINRADLDLFIVMGSPPSSGAGYRVPLAAVMFVAETTGRLSFVVPGLIAAWPPSS